MSQRPFAATILGRAGMLDCNPAKTPAIAGRKYTSSDCPTTDDERAALATQGFNKKKYHSIQAAINYLTCITRDDLRFAHGKLAKYCKDPGEEHFKAQKHLLRYIAGTLHYGIEFIWNASDQPKTDGPLDIAAWSDSSFSDDIDTARTTLGNVIKVNGATISSMSKLSTRVDSCINHSELNAFAATTGAPTTTPKGDTGRPTDGASLSLLNCSRTLVWVRGIKAGLEQRDTNSIPSTPVYVDNAGVLAMVNDVTLKSANKHIYRSLAEIRERVHLDKLVRPVKVPTKENLANAMTKQEPAIAESAAQLRQIIGPRSV